MSSAPSGVAPNESSSVTLAVGARYACFFCRVRSQRGGRCERCGRKRFELSGKSANSRLVQLARRVFKANAVHHGRPQRERALHAISHLLGVAGSALTLWLAVHHPGFASNARLWVLLLAAIVGYVGGMLSVALFLLAIWLTVAFVALSLSVAIIAGAMAAYLATYALFGERGRAARSAVVRGTERAIGRVFEPVFRLRGDREHEPRSGARRHEGLRPVRLELEAPRRPLRFEGLLVRGSEKVALGELRAPIVGVSGYTVGARLADAFVAPFVIETNEGRVRVELDVGEVIFAIEQQSERVVSELPTQWGVAAAKVRLEQMPPNERVSVYCADEGAMVRVEGGELSERAAITDREGYRDATFERAVRGTEEHPVRVTVLRVRRG